MKVAMLKVGALFKFVNDYQHYNNTHEEICSVNYNGIYKISTVVAVLVDEGIAF
jgi:hypothetical protein